MLAALWNDLRYSARTLRRSPAFSITAVATIALGVGLNAGIFTIVNGVFFRNLPAPDGHELVSISQTIEGLENRRGRTAFSTAEYRALSERMETLSGILGHSDPTNTVLGGATPQRVAGTIVTCEYFDVLQQPPVLGRGLRAADCAAGADPVVVMAHDLWSTTFEADPGVIGRTLELNRQLFTVVGVAREGTFGGLEPYRTAYFAPISAQPLLLPDEDTFSNDNRGWLTVIGRRVASIEQARAELDVIAAQFDSAQVGRVTTMRVERATPIGGFFRASLSDVSVVMMTSFAFVLLIACVNVANLLLIRAAARSREIAVRLALGASRGRVVRQGLIQSLLIFITGGAGGCLLGFWSFQALLALALPMITPPGVRPVFVDASPDVGVLVALAAVTIATGFLFGLAPALRASSPNLHAVIKQGVANLAGRRGARLQATFVGVQVAMCMVLMIGVGLMLRAVYATLTVDPGFDARNVVVASYDLLAAGYDNAEAATFQQRLLDEVSALPGVEAAAQAILEPLNLDREDRAVRLPTQDPTERRVIDVNGVSPDYFSLLSMPIVRGRAFGPADTTNTAVSAIITETTARNLWPGQEAVGQTLMISVGRDAEVAFDIVGVVQDAQVTGLGQTPSYYLYLPATPRAAQALQLVVKSRSDLASTSAAVREAVRRLDPSLVVEVMPLEANLAYARNLSGMMTGLGATLGILALVLCSVGIYGVVTYFVEQRTREIGIRSALGARFGDVLKMVLKRTLGPVLLGAAAGLVAAILMSGTLSGVLFGVSPFDPLGIGAAAAFVLAVALGAAIVPGRKAARVQPMTALHYE